MHIKKLFLVLIIEMFFFYCNGQPNVFLINKKTECINHNPLLVQEEVCAINTKNGELFIAWVDRKKDTNEKFISFKVSDNNGSKWDSTFSYDPAEYIWTANPAIAEDDNGNLFLIAMSNNYDGRKLPDNGVFEITRSADKGKTWSAWNTVVKNKAKHTDMPDKPSLIAKGNGELYLSYINFNADSTDIFNFYGEVMFAKSTDGGKTWSTPVVINAERNWKKTSMAKALISGGADFGEQGPAMCFYKNQILVSFGSYSKKGIRFTSTSDNGKSFTKVRKIANSNAGAPVTSIISNNLNEIAILWHDAHATGSVNYIISTDGGVSWSKSVTLSNKASMISGAIDSEGNIHFLWNEKESDNVDTKYTFTKATKNDFFVPVSLLEVKAATCPKFFIGAYQQFLIDKNNAKHAFWIDWSAEGGRLMHSAWK